MTVTTARLHAGRLVVALLAASSVGPPCAAAWHGETDRYLAVLAAPEAGRAAGLTSVARPRGIVNRLDVVFEDGVPKEERIATMQRLAREFVMRLWKETGITAASVVERSPSGRALDRIAVTLNAGHAPNPASPDPPPRPKC